MFEKETVLVIVPHQDDEQNLAGSILYDWSLAGSRVFVLFTTNGDRFGLGHERLLEARRALGVAGIPPANIDVLDYCDMHRCAAVHSYHVEHLHNSIVEDIKDRILLLRPSVILCVDADEHPDHIATSLMFEEAVSQLLEDKAFWPCLIYKGFAYDTAYNATKDYDEKLLRATIRPRRIGNISYEWDNRVRFYPSLDCCKSLKEGNPLCKALSCHSSQHSLDHWDSIVNADKVFWQRNTDNLIYSTHCRASSGAIDKLFDFRLYDVRNVMSRKWKWLSLGWTPDQQDSSKEISFSFCAATTVETLNIVESAVSESHISDLDIFIDGGLFCTVNLRSTLPGTVVPLGKKVREVKLRIRSYRGECPTICLVELLPPSADDLLYIAPEIDGDLIRRGVCRRIGSDELVVLGCRTRSGMVELDSSDYQIEHMGSKGNMDLFRLSAIGGAVSPEIFSVTMVGKTRLRVMKWILGLKTAVRDLLYKVDLNYRKARILFGLNR